MKFLRATILVAGLLMLGRITGFLREIVIAQIGGASQQSDVIIVFLTFPDMMISLLLGGGLMAALVPAYRSLPPALAIALFIRATLVIGALFGLLAAGIAVWSGAALGVVAPGWTEALTREVTPLFRVTLIALPVTAITGVAVAFLNSREKFIYGAVGTLIFNTCVIIALLLFTGLSPIIAVTIGVLSGAGLRLAVQVAASSRFWQRPDFAGSYERNDLLRRFAGSFGFFSILALMPPLARAYASLVEPGALSLINYAYKLMELPMAIIVSAIITVLLPRLSGQVRDGKSNQAAQSLGLAIRAVVVLLLGIAITVIFQAESLVRLVFYGAPFMPEQFSELGTVVALGFGGLLFQGLIMLYGSAFVSYDRTGALVLASGSMVAVMAALGYALQTALGLSGVMIAYATTQLVGAVVLSFWAIRITGIQPFAIALSNPLKAILLPALACLFVAWGCREIEVWGLPAMVLSSGVFMAIHLWSDPKIVLGILHRRKS